MRRVCRQPLHRLVFLGEYGISTSAKTPEVPPAEVPASLERVPGASTMRKIARVSLVRVFAVLAMVVGIALLQGTPCERDVVPTGQCTVSIAQVVADSAVAVGAELPGDLGGVPEVCLAVLFVVLLAVAGLRLPRLVALGVASAVLPWRAPDRRPEVRLVQLCVLRA